MNYVPPSRSNFIFELAQMPLGITSTLVQAVRARPDRSPPASATRQVRQRADCRTIWPSKLDVLLQLSGSARKVTEGLSPKIDRYAAAKRPSSQKPKRVAISVTELSSGDPRRSAPRARCIRRSTRKRLGAMPSCSRQYTSSVRRETPSVAHISERYRGSLECSIASRLKRLTIAVRLRRLADLLSQLPLRQTIHEGFDQQFLKPTRRVRIADHLGRCQGKLRSRCMQASQSCHCFPINGAEHRGRSNGDLLPGQSQADPHEIIWIQGHDAKLGTGRNRLPLRLTRWSEPHLTGAARYTAACNRRSGGGGEEHYRTVGFEKADPGQGFLQLLHPEPMKIDLDHRRHETSPASHDIVGGYRSNCRAIFINIRGPEYPNWMARPVPTHPAVACGDVPEFDISLIILLIGIRLQQIRNAGCLFRIVRQAHLSLPLTASMRIDGSEVQRRP